MENLLYLLSGDCAMSSVLPSISWDYVNACIDDVTGGNINQKNLLHRKEFSGEMVHLISMVHKYDCITLVTSFITWIMERIKLVHKFNHTKPPPQPIKLLSSWRNSLLLYCNWATTQKAAKI